MLPICEISIDDLLRITCASGRVKPPSLGRPGSHIDLIAAKKQELSSWELTIRCESTSYGERRMGTRGDVVSGG
jgi:hypothetical protein